VNSQPCAVDADSGSWAAGGPAALLQAHAPSWVLGSSPFFSLWFQVSAVPGLCGRGEPRPVWSSGEVGADSTGVPTPQ
jgi:hypothetical protein